MQLIDLKLFDYRYFPYELKLAEREIAQLLQVEPARLRRVSSGFRVECDFDAGALHRLTYVREAVSSDGQTVVPLQAILEKSLSGANRRQNTRYSAHGIHDYKGKFNPQIARVVSNLLGLPPTARIWDPFCGSGTVVLEALHDGRSALGTDLNPLAVAIANAKADAMRAAETTLRAANEAFLTAISENSRLEDVNISNRDVDRMLGKLWLSKLPNPEYLCEWFTYPVLGQMHVALSAIEEVVPVGLRRLFRVFVSQSVRAVSLQEPADLRIRRRKEALANYPALTTIAQHATSQIARIAAARECIGAPRGRQFSVCGDSRDISTMSTAARAFLAEGVDCVLTSPPYATALPYVDTQRLNLALLGIGDPQKIRRLDADLLGSREISGAQRTSVEKAIAMNADRLPRSVINTSLALLRAYDPETDGFRRANVPALFYRYVVGMQSCIRAAHSVLRDGGAFVLVVGPNQTTLGGKKLEIDTPEILGRVGEANGYMIADSIGLDAYHRYSMHSQNSIREERMLVLRKRPASRSVRARA